MYPQTSARTAPRNSARDMAMIAVFAAITAALGLLPPIPVPVSPVPITAQSLGPMLAGSVLGARKGFASQALFLVLLAIGLPLLPNGRGGLGVFFGASGGFLIGWALAALVIGALTDLAGAPYSVVKGIAFNIIGGIVVLYAVGTLGVVLKTQMKPWAALTANAPYLVGDAAKVVIASLVAAGVHKAYPGLLRNRRTA